MKKLNKKEKDFFNKKTVDNFKISDNFKMY